MSQDTSGARISHAHSVDPLKDGKLAEASKTLEEQFAKATELRQAQHTKEQGSERTGSEMVRETGPKLNLTPPQATRHEVDRQAHESALAKDFARAKEMNEQIKARHARENQSELKHERDYDYGREP